MMLLTLQCDKTHAIGNKIVIMLTTASDLERGVHQSPGTGQDPAADVPLGNQDPTQ
jgi:hypothetical protein